MTAARARRLAAELARRGLDVPTLDNLRDFLDLLDPDGDDDELVGQIAEWMDELIAGAEASQFAAAVIERAGGAAGRQSATGDCQV